MILGIVPLAHSQGVYEVGLERMYVSNRDELSGSARFVGLSGAMTCIGGDPSAAKQNPAGLGIYRHSQFSLSADGVFRHFHQRGIEDEGAIARWHISQASYVFAYTHPDRISGVVSNNLMLSYARRADYVRNVHIVTDTYNQAGTNWGLMDIDESGSVYDVDLHYAMNISDRFYWGMGMTLEWLNMRQTVEATTYTISNRRGIGSKYSKTDNYMGNGVGWNMSAGVLYRPLQALRIGASVQAPRIGKMRETDWYEEDQLETHYESPDAVSQWRILSPVEASGAIGVQFGRIGIFTGQYDMQYHRMTGFSHTARAGLELVAGKHWVFDMGYACTFAQMIQHASAAIHYMGNWIRVGMAYSASWYSMRSVNYQFNMPIGTFDSFENRLVFTFQWNS